MASIRGGFFPALSSVAHSDAWKWQAVEDRGQQLGAAAIRASLETYERALAILNAIALAGHEAAMRLCITERLEKKTQGHGCHDGRRFREGCRAVSEHLSLGTRNG
jgi:hypothetical protein